MAKDPLWRRLARRVRRRLYTYLAPEILNTVEPLVERLRVEFAAERDAAAERLAQLHQMLEHTSGVLLSDRETSRGRLAQLETAGRELGERVARDHDAVSGRLAEFAAVSQELHETLSRDRDAAAERLTQLHQLLQHMGRVLQLDRDTTSGRLAQIEALGAELGERIALIDALGRDLGERIARDHDAANGRLTEIEAVVGALREQLASERAGWDQRLAKFELLALEHPDILATTQQDHPFASPAVSIVMPTWNRGPVIGAAIRSVQAQRFSDWELLVIDDGSTDDTAAVVAAFAEDTRIRYIPQAHSGQCKARNHALRLARGALIAYLDSDNVWYPGYLAGAVAVFAANPAVDCAYGAMITDAHRPGERILFDRFDRDRLLAANFIGMSTFIHRRDLVDRYGGFDEELSALEDWDLILRFTAHAPPYRLPFLAVRYRVVDDKRVTVTESMDVAGARVRAKWSSG